jgi:hypothetical protein
VLQCKHLLGYTIEESGVGHFTFDEREERASKVNLRIHVESLLSRVHEWACFSDKKNPLHLTDLIGNVFLRSGIYATCKSPYAER